jgi:hypothetical protein
MTPVFLDIERLWWNISFWLAINLPKLKFRSVYSSLLVTFSLIENSESPSKVIYLRQLIYKRRGHTIPFCHPHCRVCIYIYIYIWYAPNNWCLSGSVCWWHLYICYSPQRGLCSQKSSDSGCGLRRVHTHCWVALRARNHYIV